MDSVKICVCVYNAANRIYNTFHCFKLLSSALCYNRQHMIVVQCAVNFRERISEDSFLLRMWRCVEGHVTTAFRRNVVRSSLGSRSTRRLLWRLPHPQNEGTNGIRNVENLHNGIAFNIPEDLIFSNTAVRTRNVTPLNLLNPTGHVMHQQFNIQQLYVLPTPYLCVLYLSENKQRPVPLTA